MDLWMMRQRCEDYDNDRSSCEHHFSSDRMPCVWDHRDVDAPACREDVTNT